MNFGSRFKGVITEAPAFDITQISLDMLAYYKVFHLVSDKKIKKVQKKYKKFAAGKLDTDILDWLPAKMKYTLDLNNLGPRYSDTYICKFIITRTIPKIRHDTPKSKISPMHMIGVLMHKNFWLDPNDRKLQKLFGIRREQAKKTFYNEWNGKLMIRAIRDYLKINTHKEFNGKKFFEVKIIRISGLWQKNDHLLWGS
jgi:hypothetical protein